MCCKTRGMQSAGDGRQQGFELIGDSRQCGMNHDRPEAGCDTFFDDLGNVAPIGGARDARAAELEHEQSLAIHGIPGGLTDTSGETILVVLEYIAQFLL